MKAQPYPTDLTDDQYALIAPLLPPAKPGGRPRSVDVRDVLDAIFYLNRAGCQWRMLPHDFPPCSTVHTYYRAWRRGGVWENLVDALRPQVRQAARRNPTPEAAYLDSQTVKSDHVGQTGYDGGQKIKGRKRHMAVDSLGLLLAVVVTGAGVLDGTAAPDVLGLLDPDRFPRLERVWVDNAYHRQPVWDFERRYGGFQVRVVSRPPDKVGWVHLPKRWVVEGSFAWLVRCRRPSKDYEVLPASSEAMTCVSFIHLMARRLKPVRQTHPFKYRPTA